MVCRTRVVCKKKGENGLSRVKRLDLSKFKGKRLFIIDANAVAGTKYWGFKNFAWEVRGKRIGTGAVYAILSLFKEIPIQDRVIFCFDSIGNFRKKEYKGYKSGRTDFGESYHKQLELTKKILVSCGFEVYSKKGYEADDFVVGAVDRYKGEYDYVFVYTNDNDLSQVVDDNVYIKSVHSRRSDITKENYKEVVGVPYNTVLLYKALVGCSSDRVKGVKGFGEKRFEKLIKRLKEVYKLDEIREKDLEEEIIKDFIGLNDNQKKDALRSLNIVRHRIPDGFRFGSGGLVNINLFKWYLKRYGMKSILRDVDELRSVGLV